ncbi:MAG: hypothetical protein Q7T82_08140 [Armatimonadota bacterium]|nr:hypothetical protein [Armatimonadota bacterium]
MSRISYFGRIAGRKPVGLQVLTPPRRFVRTQDPLPPVEESGLPVGSDAGALLPKDRQFGASLGRDAGAVQPKDRQFGASLGSDAGAMQPRDRQSGASFGSDAGALLPKDLKLTPSPKPPRTRASLAGEPSTNSESPLSPLDGEIPSAARLRKKPAETSHKEVSRAESLSQPETVNSSAAPKPEVFPPDRPAELAEALRLETPRRRRGTPSQARRHPILLPSSAPRERQSDNVAAPPASHSAPAQEPAKQPAAVHIGSIDVQVVEAPTPKPPARQPARPRPAGALARGFTSLFGLRQG